MRAFIASSVGVVTASLTLPFLIPAGAAAVRAATAAAPATSAAPVAGSTSAVPGRTQSLPLVPLPQGTGAGSAARAGAVRGGTALGLPPRKVAPFSLLGVVWDRVDAEPRDQVQIRTRAAATGVWSRWRDLPVGHGHAPGREVPGLRGGTEPLWVGPSDGVEVRTRARSAPAHGGGHRVARVSQLPSGMRLELVDPGPGPDRTADPTAPRRLAPLSRRQTVAQAVNEDRHVPAGLVGPRPGIVTRAGWKADERLRQGGFTYTGRLRVALVHHSAGGNGYHCSQAPAIIRGIYRYHVISNRWRDLGYNFLIDKCGTIYEGRAGGVIEPVLGAHTLGFNNRTMGVAVLGSYGSTRPSRAALEGIAKLTAWKLGLSRVRAGGTTTLISDGGKYPKGTSVRFRAISGHRDGFTTECPGALLQGELGTVRAIASRLQGR